MSIVSRAILKSYFETGDTPSQAQYEDLIDSLVHQSEFFSSFQFKNAAFTPDLNLKYLVSSSLGTFTITLPGSPLDGDYIEILTDSMPATITIDGNGSLINGASTQDIDQPKVYNLLVYYNSEWTLLSFGDTSLLDNRVTTLEDNDLTHTYYEVVPNTLLSSSVSVPTGASVLLDTFGSGADALVSTLDGNNYPTFEPPVDSGGNEVTLTFDINGNFVLSAQPTDSNVAIIYRFKIKQVNQGNVDADFIIDQVNSSVIKAIDVEYPNDGTAVHATELQDVITHIWSTTATQGFGFTDNGDGTVTIAAGEVVIRDTANFDSPIIARAVTGGTSGTDFPALPDNEQSFIYLKMQGGVPVFDVGTDPTIVNGYDQVILWKVVRIGNTIHQGDLRFFGNDHAHLNSTKDFFVNGYQWHPGGTILSEVGTRSLNLTAGKFYLVNLPITHSAFNTDSTDTFTKYHTLDTGATWVRTAAQTQIDNTQYNQGGTSLTNLSNNYYKVVWVYLILNGTDILAVVEDWNQYQTLPEAQAAAIPSTLPPELDQYSTGILVGRIIIQEGATNTTEVSSPFLATLQAGVPVTHNNLGGLQGGAPGLYFHMDEEMHSTWVKVNETGVDPVATNDVNDGYNVRSTWFNNVTKVLWLCIDRTAGAAVWVRILHEGMQEVFTANQVLVQPTKYDYTFVSNSVTLDGELAETFYLDGQALTSNGVLNLSNFKEGKTYTIRFEQGSGQHNLVFPTGEWINDGGAYDFTTLANNQNAIITITKINGLFVFSAKELS